MFSATGYRIVAEKAQEATESKFRFFTNISHEFRTPLTLILGPVEELLRQKNENQAVKKNLSLVQRNSATATVAG